MNKYIRILLIGWLSVFVISSPTFASDNQEIKKKIIRESINNYPGNCPCPYNRDRAGRKCGKRSAYSKPGGYSPLCYPSDVSQEMIENYKRKKGN